MKKICIVTHHFHPEINARSFRATELANELSRRGYNVTVLYANKKIKIDNYNENKVPSFKVDVKEKNKEFSKRRKKSLKSIKKYASKTLQYFFGDVKYFKYNKYISDKLDCESYDVIISIGGPVYIQFSVSNIIRNCQNFYGVSISDWGDPFFGSSGLRHASYIKKVQKKVINTFDFITVPIEEAREYYLDYTNHKKIKVIPQGFVLKDNEFHYEKNEIPRFVYAGAFYKDIRNPEKLFKTLADINEDFVFEVYTNLEGDVYEEILVKYQHILKEKLQLHNKVSRDKILQILSTSDFVLNLENRDNWQNPSKLIDLAISGRPILSINPENPNEDIIHNFIRGDYSHQTIVDLSKYDIKKVVNKFEDLFTEGENYE